MRRDRTGRYVLGDVSREVRKRIRQRPTMHNRIVATRAALRRDQKMRVIELPASAPRRGRALISLTIEPFLLPSGAAIPHDHTQWWETAEIVRIHRELGYDVDVMWWMNREFLPEQRYDLLIDARMNLERLAPFVGPDCLKVMRCDTAHWLFHSTAQHERLLALQRRRGFTLMPRKGVDPNLGIESADRAFMHGNDFVESTYAHAGKPIDRVPSPSPRRLPWPDGKDFETARRHFVWYGSSGLVHKGLDLVLEAFARTPDYRLTVCGPISGERDFERAYHRELYETPNIDTRGWIDVMSGEFVDLMTAAGAIVFPSCSEAQNSGVIVCMHAGVLPVVTREVGIDVDPFGVAIGEGTVDAVEKAVHQVGDMPLAELGERSRLAWEFAHEHHNRDRYSARYREIALDMVGAG